MSTASRSCERSENSGGSVRGRENQWSCGVQRHGMTIPLSGPLHAQRATTSRSSRPLGYTDLWSAEANTTDGLVPLALASVWAPTMRLGTAILPVYTRGPALLAQSIATLAIAAPGPIRRRHRRVVQHHRRELERPAVRPALPARARHAAVPAQGAVAGEKIGDDYETFSVSGFRLGGRSRAAGADPRGRRCARACCDSRGARATARSSIGCLRTTPRPSRRHRQRARPRQGRRRAHLRVPQPRPRRRVPAAKFAMAAYLNVPVYRAFHEWLGRGDMLAEHWAQWDAGDRKGSLVQDPRLARRRAHRERDAGASAARTSHRYVANGITTPALMIMPFGGIDVREAALRARSPADVGRRRLSARAMRAADLAAVPRRRVDDLLGPNTKLLIVGINPGLWTAAVNAHFARPGNRFWPALHRGACSMSAVDASNGLRPRSSRAPRLGHRHHATSSNIATARADELTARPVARSARSDCASSLAAVQPTSSRCSGSPRTATRSIRAPRGGPPSRTDLEGRGTVGRTEPERAQRARNRRTRWLPRTARSPRPRASWHGHEASSGRIPVKGSRHAATVSLGPGNVSRGGPGEGPAA